MTEHNMTSARLIVCLKKPHVRIFFDSFFSVHFVAKRYMLGSWNTLVQLLALYTDPESHNVQQYRQTDDTMMPVADHTA